MPIPQKRMDRNVMVATRIASMLWMVVGDYRSEFWS